MGINRRGGVRLGRFVALTVLLCLAAPPPAAQAQQEDVVKLGDLFAISNAAIYIAIDKGYFKDQGIRNEITNFASAAKMLPALTAGEIEVSVGTASAGLFNAIVAGAPYRIVGDKGQSRPGNGYVLLAVRKDLVDSGQVKSVRDLKGRKVATFAPGIIQTYLMGKMAEEVGLTIKDFEITYLGAPQQVTAFETKAIDAAQTVEPWGSRFEERGVAVKFRTPDQVKGLTPVQIACIIYSGKFIHERRDVAQRWMNAYLKAAKLFAERGTKEDELTAIIAKYTKNPVNVIKAAIPHYQAPDGKLVLESLADQIKWFVANGYMQEPVPMEKVVDLSFLK